MYTAPELNRIGNARDLVLGLVDLGVDLDGTAMVGDLENGPEYPFPISVPQD